MPEQPCHANESHQESKIQAVREDLLKLLRILSKEVVRRLAQRGEAANDDGRSQREES